MTSQFFSFSSSNLVALLNALHYV